MSKMAAPVSDQSAPSPELSEDMVRDYAYHLYEQSNCAPGHDVDNWLEATACLKAHIPANSSHRRLHQHVNGPAIAKLPATST
jgi:hypothetical protein